MSPLLVLGALAVAQNAGGYAIVITNSAGELDSSDVGKLWRRAAGWPARVGVKLVFLTRSQVDFHLS